MCTSRVICYYLKKNLEKVPVEIKINIFNLINALLKIVFQIHSLMILVSFKIIIRMTYTIYY